MSASGWLGRELRARRHGLAACSTGPRATTTAVTKAAATTNELRRDARARRKCPGGLLPIARSIARSVARDRFSKPLHGGLGQLQPGGDGCVVQALCSAGLKHVGLARRELVELLGGPARLGPRRQGLLVAGRAVSGRISARGGQRSARRRPAVPVDAEVDGHVGIAMPVAASRRRALGCTPARRMASEAMSSASSGRSALRPARGAAGARVVLHAANQRSSIPASLHPIHGLWQPDSRQDQPLQGRRQPWLHAAQVGLQIPRRKPSDRAGNLARFTCPELGFTMPADLDVLSPLGMDRCRGRCPAQLETLPKAGGLHRMKQPARVCAPADRSGLLAWVRRAIP